MIIILSTENDFTTIEVINWLTRYKVKHTVLYANDFLTNAAFENLTSEGIQKYIEEKIQCALSEVKVVWCRKWRVKSTVRENFINELAFENNKAVYISSLAEIEEINSLLLGFFPKKRVIKKQKSRNLIERMCDNHFEATGILAQLVRVPHVRD